MKSYSRLKRSPGGAARGLRAENGGKKDWGSRVSLGGRRGRSCDLERQDRRPEGGLAARRKRARRLMRAPARRARAAVRRAARGVVVVQLTALRGVQQLDVRGGESGGQCALAGTESEGEPAGSDERHEAERNERAQQQRRQQQRCESPAAPSEVGKPRTHGGRVYRLAEPLIWVKHPSRAPAGPQPKAGLPPVAPPDRRNSRTGRPGTQRHAHHRLFRNATSWRLWGIVSPSWKRRS